LGLRHGADGHTGRAIWNRLAWQSLHRSPPGADSVAAQGNARISFNRDFQTRQSDSTAIAKVGKHLDGKGRRRDCRQPQQSEKKKNGRARKPAQSRLKKLTHEDHFYLVSDGPATAASFRQVIGQSAIRPAGILDKPS